MSGFYVPLTATGRGAIAVIRIEADPGTFARLPLSRFPKQTDRPTLVAWNDSIGPPTSTVPDEIFTTEPVAEEVVVRRLPMVDVITPGNIAIELCCHGGRAAIRRIMRNCRDVGIESVTQKWFMSQSIGRSLADSTDNATDRAVAWQRFLQAPTPRIAATFFDQAQGGIGRALQRLQRMAERLRAISENDPMRKTIAESFRRRLKRLRRLVPYGRQIVREPRIVLVGAPNVGKSSILNRLAGFDRAIVHGCPGTTRDVIGQQIVLGGIPVRIEDTAGLRVSDDQLENAGMRRTHHAMRRADLIVEVIEYGTKRAESSTISNMPPSCPVIRVMNKMDLAESTTTSMTELFSDAIGVSARTGDGMDQLATAILQRLIPTFPRPGEPVPFLARHRREIRELKSRSETLNR